jgi:hypothetical protein
MRLQAISQLVQQPTGQLFVQWTHVKPTWRSRRPESDHNLRFSFGDCQQDVAAPSFVGAES